MLDVLKGELVHLGAVDPEEMSGFYSQWSRDSEYSRLANSNPAYPQSIKAARNFIENDLEKDSSNDFFFSMRRLEDDRLLGDIGLGVLDWSSRDAFVGIAIGGRDFWGKGYGTDAMRVILGYAFLELNLRRVTLTVFEYNPRAIRSYEKAGFQHEGRQRGRLQRADRRWDTLFMGILRRDWMEQNGIKT